MTQATVPAPHAPPSRPSPLAAFLKATELDIRMLGMVGALLLIWIAFHLLSGGLFLTPRNLWNLSVQSAPVAIMATGMVLVIVTRNIDLSIGSMLGFIGMAIFGGTLPATRIAVAAIDPLALTALRTAIAGIASLALLIVLRRQFPPRRLWLQLGVASLCVSVLFPFLMALAVITVDAAHGGVVMGALPIATALVAVLITHERPRPLFV